VAVYRLLFIRSTALASAASAMLRYTIRAAINGIS
jgi:hypothetical protein